MTQVPCFTNIILLSKTGGRSYARNCCGVSEKNINYCSKWRPTADISIFSPELLKGLYIYHTYSTLSIRARCDTDRYLTSV